EGPAIIVMPGIAGLHWSPDRRFSACPRQSGFPMTSAKWRVGSRGRIDPGRLDLGRVVLALDRPERGPGLAGAQPPSGVLGEQTFDDRAQRAGAQERCRPVDKNSGEGGEP